MLPTACSPSAFQTHWLTMLRLVVEMGRTLSLARSSWRAKRGAVGEAHDSFLVAFADDLRPSFLPVNITVAQLAGLVDPQARIRQGDQEGPVAQVSQVLTFRVVCLICPTMMTRSHAGKDFWSYPHEGWNAATARSVLTKG